MVWTCGDVLPDVEGIGAVGRGKMKGTQYTWPAEGKRELLQVE